MGRLGKQLKRKKEVAIKKIVYRETEKQVKAENRETKPWERGFENGALTDAIQLRIKVRELMRACGQ
ncbi:hypothetical protein [Anaerovibrio lipolyticus]|uniref:hypothetical protein n=1 Tax=Anaerovibrio lipolyticus TaxID=82374 RepID=UPI0026F26ED1|nr:hypothetical protein [Anaerovibrio lipolyticus]MBE6105980.1 hypothetical protein [Anaerovibrio lipolyticus]